MNREISLIGWLPEFMAQYREMKVIQDVVNPECQQACDQTEVVKDNQFICSCDLSGIKKFEELLGISPLADDTLETRRFRVMTRWGDDIPYTYPGLVEKFNLLIGDGRYELAEDFKNYRLDLEILLPFDGLVEDVKYLLETIVPANIVTGIACKSPVMETGFFAGGMVGGSVSVTVLEEYRPSLEFCCKEYVAGVCLSVSSTNLPEEK